MLLLVSVCESKSPEGKLRGIEIPALSCVFFEILEFTFASATSLAMSVGVCVCLYVALVHWRSGKVQVGLSGHGRGL